MIITQEEKELLLKDLSARLPYGVKIEGYELPCIILDSYWLHFMYTHQEFAVRRPYLRPMSSMTDEEKMELRKNAIAISYNYKDEIIGLQHNTFEQMNVCCNWLNSHHFDYRGLIEKGLALKAPEGMYNKY